MNVREVCSRIADLEQRAVELAAHQAALQQAIGYPTLYLADYKTIKAKLDVVRAELQAVQASLADAWQQQKDLLASIDTTVAYRMGGPRSWQSDRDALAG